MGRYKNIILLCPIVLTGGPEAIHQLAKMLTDIGQSAMIFYYGLKESFEFGNGSLIKKTIDCSQMLGAYAQYAPKPANDVIPLDKETLVIIPEVLAYKAEKFKPATVAIWWLSVANAKGRLAEVQNAEEMLRDNAVVHLCQSEYAHDFLRGAGVEKRYDLVDYVDPLFTKQWPTAPNKKLMCVFNHFKGAALGTRFSQLNPDLQVVPIGRMPRDRVYSLLYESTIYLEFGHNPGKDRLPREAAACGCIVVARNIGGSSYFSDMPLKDHFKFEDIDVESGKLSSFIKNVLSDPNSFWEEQIVYRRYVHTEYHLIRLQTRRLFG